jgi:hypothetical protein
VDGVGGLETVVGWTGLVMEIWSALKDGESIMLLQQAQIG